MSNGIAPAYQLTRRSPATVRVVQITDPHLYEADDGKLLGLTTAQSFDAVIDSVRHLSAQDLMLVTGDISQDGTPGSYQRLCKGVAGFDYPCFWIPGNHDELPVMSQHLHGPNMHSAKRIVIGQWQIVLLNSSVPRRVYGKLLQDQIDVLQHAIREYPDHHVLVVLHHHPVAVESAWLDTIGLNNPEPLFAALVPHKKAKAVLWGHVHQAYDAVKDGVRLLATPSTCVQFKPRSTDFQADTESPGYRTLQLHDDGRIDTSVTRIEHIQFTVDYSVKGY